MVLLIPGAVNKILEKGRREGLEQGREVGREEGREEGREAERERIRQLMQDSGAPRTLEEAEILFEQPKEQ